MAEKSKSVPFLSWKGPSNTSLNLSVSGYQFPNYPIETSGDVYDANWVLIGLKASENQETWSATDPALLSDELVGLQEWLQGLIAGKSRLHSPNFIENVLEFKRLKNAGHDFVFDVTLRGQLAFPGNPPGKRMRTLRLQSSKAVLEETIASISACMKIYPVKLFDRLVKK